MDYTCTRDSLVKVTGCEAIANGIASDGGLYVPSSFPNISADEIAALCDMTYPERAAFVLNGFFDFGYDKLKRYADAAYGRFDDADAPCPVVKIDESTYILELFHGPTLAFKDMALTMLPYLMTESAKTIGRKEKTLVLVATSGDTGKAALEGFKDVENTAVIVFYPADGVSDMQKLQMQTQEGENLAVFAIDGNFDDAQTAVKNVFVDEEIKRKLKADGYVLSSANSINWGRLAPQIAYYFSAYADLLKSGEIRSGDKINFCVPTGNFGNILAAYYAKLMGLPVNKLICASNENNVLTDFFSTGVYDTNREFFKTSSPSMDILFSSNLERLLFELSGRNCEFVKGITDELKQNGKYKVDMSLLSDAGFEAGFATEEETFAAIDGFYDLHDYVLDPHTAVAMVVYNDYVARTGDYTPTVVASTASAYKFPECVYRSIAREKTDNAMNAARKLRLYTGLPVPEQIEGLSIKPVRFSGVADKNDIGKIVLDFIDNK